MKKEQSIAYNSYMTTGVANYFSSTSASRDNEPTDNIKVSIGYHNIVTVQETGRYSVFDIANWFLSKKQMTNKKLQKLCYYAQAWNYALHDFKLMDTEFEAWVHGPVSPALYDRFKSFGYDPIKLINKPDSAILEEDVNLLEDIWETYGEMTGNELEILAHREDPWKEARQGCGPNERCNVAIRPDTMKRYYKSIYIEE